MISGRTAAESFVHQHGFWCSDAAASTHTSMVGGKCRIPPAFADAFHRACAADALEGRSNFFIERRSFPLFRPYFDIDLTVCEERAGEMSQFVLQLAESICVSLHSFCAPLDASLCAADSATMFRCVCLVASPATQGAGRVRWGIHIVFPNVQITIRNMIIMAKRVSDSERVQRVFESVGSSSASAIDTAVYSTGSLRMAFSDKASMCPICAKPPVAQSRDTLTALSRAFVSGDARLDIVGLDDDENAMVARVLTRSSAFVESVRRKGRALLMDAIRESEMDATDAPSDVDSDDSSHARESWRDLFILCAEKALCVPPAVCAAALDSVSRKREESGRSSEFIMAGSQRAIFSRSIDLHREICIRGKMPQHRPYMLAFAMDGNGVVMRDETRLCAENPERVLQNSSIRAIDRAICEIVCEPGHPSDAIDAERLAARAHEARDPSQPRMLVGGLNDLNSDILDPASSNACRIVSLIRTCANFVGVRADWIRRKRDGAVFVLAVDPACSCARSCLNLKNREHHRSSRVYFEIRSAGIFQRCTCRKSDVADRETGKPCALFSYKIGSLDQSDRTELFSKQASFSFICDTADKTRKHAPLASTAHRAARGTASASAAAAETTGQDKVRFRS
jgi:hypothetical protein